MKDKLFNQSIPPSYKFKFDESVAEVFDDMLGRSIPFYDEVRRMGGELAQTFFQPHSNIYDLGCSTGALLSDLARLPLQSPHLIGVDSSPDMIKKAQTHLADLPDLVQMDLLCEDILQTSIENASVIVMNYTLQFIPLASRIPFLKRLYNGMLPGGVFIVSEKTEASSHMIRQHEVKFYEALKKRNGYSELEIAQKRKALENVLIAQSVETNMDQLNQAGFTAIDIIFKWYNFVSFLAIKPQS